MKFPHILLLISFLYCYSFAVPQNSGHRTIQKNSNLSKYKYSSDTNEAKIATTTDVGVTGICNGSVVFNSGDKRFSRSLQYVLENITTTETPPEITIDFSTFSTEFLDCLHILIEPGCYQTLHNGSVFIPVYNILLNRSNYLKNNEDLYICADVLDRMLDDEITTVITTRTVTTMTDVNIIDACNASPLNSNTDRSRRSIHYVLENMTTAETPPDAKINFSILNPEFLNCTHIYIEPECFQQFQNESIFIPFYKIQLNSSNYLINKKGLFICADVINNYHDDELTTTLATTFVSDTDACNASAFDSDAERIRRFIHYVSENITTTESPSDTSIDISILSPEFLNCTHIYLEPECYRKLQNGSVFVPMYNMLFDRSNYVINQQLLFICPDFFNKLLEQKFSEYIPIVSFVCACISTICIIFHIIMFSIVKKMRNLPGHCLLSLCLALIGAYSCVFIRLKEGNILECAILGMFMLYFFLASFFWMNVMAYDLWKSIRMATAKFRLTANRPFIIQYARYSLYAWGTPLTIIIISIIIHYTAPENSHFKLIFDEYSCWFKYRLALTLYFAGPLFILIGLNILFFLSSFIMISNASMSKSHSKNNQGSSDLWSRLFLSLRLGSVMGFMWIFGIIAAVTKQEWLWYLYSVCSALQGVFIFFSFTVSERSRKAFKNVFQKRKCSMLPTQSTTQQGSSF